MVPAQEIASSAFCPERWRLEHGLGLEPGNRAALEAGTRHHARKAVAERIACGAIVLGRLLAVLAVIALSDGCPVGGGNPFAEEKRHLALGGVSDGMVREATPPRRPAARPCWGRLLVLLGAAQFLSSLALLLYASTHRGRPPTWMGVIDVTLALTLVVTLALIHRVAAGRIEEKTLRFS